MDVKGNSRSFSDLLRSQRISRGTTQRQLADLSTVSIRTIRDLELGRTSRPRRVTVRLLADGLGLGGRERADFELAARQVTTTSDLQQAFDAEPAPPPAPLGEVIGRDGEVAVLRELLASGRQRLVTITGLGGVGKTMVALAVAGLLHQSHGFPVLWTSADAGTDPYRAPNHVEPLSALIGAGIAGLFALSPGMADELSTLIGNRTALIVLDGYEPDRVRMDRVVGLLQRCPGLRVLSTARLPFGAGGERVSPLPPLAVPRLRSDHNLASLARVPSVRLLIRHVREFRPDFELDLSNAAAVAELCRRLDGIPAVLGAAASWFALDDPRTVLEYGRTDPFGLVEDTLPDLRGSLNGLTWGLTDPEFAMLVRLAGLAPGWSMGEAAGLTGLPGVTSAGLVRRLLALGLVRPVDEADRTRFQVLDLVRALPPDRPGGWPRTIPSPVLHDRLGDAPWELRAPSLTSTGRTLMTLGRDR